ncbi:MAG: flagellar biosynthesis protein FliQ [Verrucomicrobia bacterium]|nr:flagellar biosynthesis protein FliQ [Verrucomicrobiota bacterium]MBI3871068.1 flagellar biosynthesis protein FliQ [Verrucomicrobiota bacterium]
MNPEYAVDLLKNTMLQAATLAAPVLLTAMTIGLLVSLFQAVTSIHEQTLSFVPKVVGILALLIFLLPWMTRSMLEFTQAMIERMPQMAH